MSLLANKNILKKYAIVQPIRILMVFLTLVSFVLAKKENNNMNILISIDNSEKKMLDMQATVRWFYDSKGSFVDYEWAYKNGMEYRETRDGYPINKDEGKEVTSTPINILSYNGEKQFSYSSTMDRSIQRGGIYGLNLIPFEASLMPRVLLGYSLLDTLADRLKKAETCSHLDQPEIIEGHTCVVLEAKKIDIGESCFQNYKVWIDSERDFRPLKIEIYRDTNPLNPYESLSRRIDNIKLQEINGIWYPVSGDIQYYRDGDILISDGRDVRSLSMQEQEKKFGGLTEEQAMKLVRKQSISRGEVQHLEISNIRLNQGIEDQKFAIKFPHGCVVWDDLLQMGYKVGTTITPQSDRKFLKELYHVKDVNHLLAAKTENNQINGDSNRLQITNQMLTNQKQIDLPERNGYAFPSTSQNTKYKFLYYSTILIVVLFSIAAIVFCFFKQKR